MTTVTAPLRVMTDQQLADAYRAGLVPFKAAAAECNRRDKADRLRARWRERQAEWDAAAYANYQAAEEYTRGCLLNERGRRAGREPWPMLWQGAEDLARRLASDELLTFWDYQQARPPGPRAYAAAKRAEIAAAAAEQEPVTVRQTTIRVNGRRVPAEWHIDQDGKATMRCAWHAREGRP